MSIFGKNIKKIRVLKNLSQQEFGDLFEISRGSIGSYEEGRAEPKLETVIKIASHYHINIEKLLVKELTVNEISQYANNIGKHLEKEVFEEQHPLKEEIPKRYLEDRVQELEERIQKLEQLIRSIL